MPSSGFIREVMVLLFYRRKAVLEVGDDIVNVLGADGKADGVLEDTGFVELLGGKLRVGGGGGMDHKALDVRDVREQGEDLEVVDELPCFFSSTLDLEGKDGGAAVCEISLV